MPGAPAARLVCVGCSQRQQVRERDVGDEAALVEQRAFHRGERRHLPDEGIEQHPQPRPLRVEVLRRLEVNVPCVVERRRARVGAPAQLQVREVIGERVEEFNCEYVNLKEPTFLFSLELY